MNTNALKPRDPAMIFIIGFITLMGGVVRLMIPISTSIPLNDGGLFYSMIVDIQNNGYSLPMYTTYNSAAIPFAYPPLAFYLTGWISDLFGWQVFDLMRVLPALISALTIPVFYLLAKELLNTKAQIVIATLTFAFIPRVFDWLIMGGGITRAPGFLFAILTIRQFYLLYTTQKPANIAGAIIFSTLTVYTHPEAPVQIAICAIVFYLFLDRSKKGLGKSIFIVIATALLTAPWWAEIISRHGASIFLAPISAAGKNSAGLFSRIFSLAGFKFTDELYLPVVALLGLIGAAVAISTKQYMLIAWLGFAYLIEPRSGPLYMMLPHAILASLAVDKLILPGLKALSAHQPQEVAVKPGAYAWADEMLAGKTTKIVLGYLFICGILSSFTTTLVISKKYTLKPADMLAFNWVRENTPQNSRFILITNEVPLRDSSSEWFPALTERRSLATVFGSEWSNGRQFASRTDSYTFLQNCSNQDETCLSDWSAISGETFDYVYIRKFIENEAVNIPLAGYLKISDLYKIVFESESAIIFRVLQ